MENEQPEQPQNFSKGTRLPKIPILLVGIILIAGITYVVYQEFGGQRQDVLESPQEKTAPSQESLEQPNIPIPPPEAPVVKSYNGRIVSLDIEAKKFKLETEHGNKEVLYTEATEIVARSRPTREQLTTLSPKELSLAMTQELQFGELTVGDIVTAISDENIREFTSFEASKILIIQ